MKIKIKWLGKKTPNKKSLKKIRFKKRTDKDKVTLKELYSKPKGKRVLKLIGKIILYLTLSLVVFFILTTILSGYSSLILGIYPPINLEEKTTKLTCKYGELNLELEVKSYWNIDNYYHYKKEKGEILSEGLFSNFVVSEKSDNLISTLASDIKALGEKNRLNEDQILELVLCFVQNIPYDTTKAEDILSDKNVLEYDIPQYPYETLYKNSGICTDKAYLGSALLQELGYSTALLLFSEDKHMALGVKVEKRYGNFDSEYAIAEVTSPGFIPGDLPGTIDDNNGKPSLVLETPSKISPNDKVYNQKVIKESDLSFPTVVIPLGEGKTYTRIAQVKELESRIYQKAEEIESIGDEIEFMEYDLIDASDNADYAYTDYLNQPAFNQRCGTRWDYLNGTQWWDCWEEENSTKNYFYNVYLDRLNYYNSLIEEYNSRIDDYNSRIDDYNYLIDSRSRYQFN